MKPALLYDKQKKHVIKYCLHDCKEILFPFSLFEETGEVRDLGLNKEYAQGAYIAPNAGWFCDRECWFAFLLTAGDIKISGKEKIPSLEEVQV
jgi:hypothetical protein